MSQERVALARLFNKCSKYDSSTMQIVSFCLTLNIVDKQIIPTAKLSSRILPQEKNNEDNDNSV